MSTEYIYVYLCTMKPTNIDTLQTIKNFALANKVTAAYIYKLMKEKKITPVIIDGVQFIDLSVYPKLIRK